MWKEIMKTVLASVLEKGTGQGIAGFSETLKGALSTGNSQAAEAAQKAKSLFNNVKSLLPSTRSEATSE